MAKINQDILKEVQMDNIDQQWLKEMEKVDRETRNNLYDLDTFFNNFEGNINKVADVIDKVPDDSYVRPSKSWLKMFGLG
jgi:hypothetical protein